MQRRIVGLTLVCFCVIATAGRAQDFKLFDRTVQIHGFASQGFVYTDTNNWLTMNTSQGSGAFTEMSLNASTQVTDKFRIGAQVYDRNLGQLGQYHPSLDWAYADYRWKSWLGFRGGKVKTTLGLYNDTQDLDFLRTFALLPQSVYPTDLRDANIGHMGGDIYGTIALQHRLGSLAYTVYGGHRSDSVYSGYPYLLSQFQLYLQRMGGLQYGADLRWRTPVKGLLVGASRLSQDITASGNATLPDDFGGAIVPYSEHSKSDWSHQFFGQYKRGKWQFDSEYLRYWRGQSLSSFDSENDIDVRGWYVSGSYKVSKHLAFGSYYSRYTIRSVFWGVLAATNPPQTDTSLPANHVYDKAVTVRVDLNRFWNVKLEGHFMDGYGDGHYPNGFYPQENPNGFKPNTNALVLKTGVNF